MGLVKTFKVGAQPVVEGIMIRGRNNYALAIEKSNGNILLDKGRINFISQKPIIFIRGIISLVESGVLAIKSLLYSTEYFDNEEKNSADEVVASKEEYLAIEDRKKAEDAQSWLIFSTSLILLVLAVIAFFILPPVIASMFFNNVDDNTWRLFNLTEGVTRIILYFIYLIIFKFLGGKIKTFRQYHSAGHKVINCFESQKELTLDNVKNSSAFHPRSGFYILFNVLVIYTVIFLLPFDFLRIDNVLLAVLIRFLVLLVSIGVSYEISRLFGLFNGKFSRAVSLVLGMWIENFTVSTPSDMQIYVAMAALQNAMIEE